MVRLSVNVFTITLGTVVAACVGYCVYFDKKRRSDPEYKKKVRERRCRNTMLQQESTPINMSSLNDPENLQKYFVQEIHLGEQLIDRGDLDGGVEHLAYAIIVSNQQSILLQMMQCSLPPNIFNLLIQKLQDPQLEQIKNAATVNTLVRKIDHRK